MKDAVSTISLIIVSSMWHWSRFGETSPSVLTDSGLSRRMGVLSSYSAGPNIRRRLTPGVREITP